MLVHVTVSHRSLKLSLFFLSLCCLLLKLNNLHWSVFNFTSSSVCSNLLLNWIFSFSYFIFLLQNIWLLLLNNCYLLILIFFFWWNIILIFPLVLWYGLLLVFDYV
jgi:hypothetical protein